MNTTLDLLLAEARLRDVKLWVEDGEVRFDGPAARLDARFVALLRSNAVRLRQRLEAPTARSVATPGRWLVPLTDHDGDARVYLLPAAGSGPRTYRAWRAAAPPGVGVVAVQAPGRDERFVEAPYLAIEPLAAGAAAAIERHADRPFALFGHSAGALVAHAVAQRLPARPPQLVVAAAARPPDLVQRDLGELDDGALRRAVAAWGGTPPELLADRGFMEVFLPVLRADLRVCSSCRRPRAPEDRLDVPIVALAGRRDATVPRRHVGAWAAWTTHTFALHEVDGGHFFPVSAAAAVLRLMAGLLDVGGPA